MKVTILCALVSTGALWFLGCAGSSAPNSTPIPPTNAATVDTHAEETRISEAIFATLTASAPSVVPPSKTPPATSTPAPSATPTSTATATLTSTPAPTVDVASEKKTFSPVDVRELKKSPDKFLDQKLLLRGDVFRIQEAGTETAMQIWVNYGTGGVANREAVVVHYAGSLPGLFEKDKVVVYGRGAGTFTGTNALGGQVTQPLITADYVDYGDSLPTAVPVPTKKPIPTLPPVPPVGKDVPTKLADKWDITYVGEFRDKVVFFYDTGKSAFGVWATVEFRIRNLQAGSISLGDDFGFVAVDQDGKVYEDDFSATTNARWQYCGCSTLFSELAPGQETVIVITYDVPETTKTLTIVPTEGAFSSKQLAAPRFVINNFDQVPPFKR